MIKRASDQIDLTKVVDGKDGTSVTILGSYNTMAELETAHPTGSRGDAYMVAGDLIIWNGTTWENVGRIQGPQGNPGTPGAPGTGVASVQPQYYLSTSDQSATGGTWGNTITFVSGLYIWSRDEITYSNGSVGHSAEVYNQALTIACENAISALAAAQAVNQYTWHTETDTGAGAGTHITMIPQDEFLDDPANGGFNVLINSLGTFIRDGLTVTAFYGASTNIGNALKPHIEITSTQMNFVTEDNNVVINIDSGTPQTIWTSTDIDLTIQTEENYSINLEGAGIGKELNFYVRDSFSAQYEEDFTIELGTASAGDVSGDVLFSYIYDGNTTLKITNENGSDIILKYVSYFKTTYLSQSYIQGELMMVNNSGQAGVWLTGSGTVDAKGYYLNGKNIFNPTLLSTDLVPLSGRCEVTNGGIAELGQLRFVQLVLTIKASLSANNTWGLLDGFDIASTGVVALAMSVNKNYGNVSGQINASGRLVVQTGGQALATNDVLTVSGWYIAQ